MEHVGTRVSTVNRLTGYDGYRILTSPNQLGNFNHGHNRLQKLEKFGHISSILAYFQLIFFLFSTTHSAFDVSISRNELMLKKCTKTNGHGHNSQVQHKWKLP